MSPQLRITLTYVVISTLWIWGSDHTLNVLVHGESEIIFLQSLKGALFVLVTGMMLYWMVGRDLRRLKLANRMLVNDHKQTLRELVSAMDIRHKETGDHSDRVMRMVVGLARLAGVEGDELRNLTFGALLHDIGKLALPDAILIKPGKLDDSEIALMRQHPQIGHDLLQRVDFLRAAGDIPYSHHERWDGTGYPQGLRSEEIPLAARIFSVVDIWDALCSPRVYKLAWPEPEVRQYLKDVAGSQLDPHLVQLFLDNLEDIKKLGADTAR